MDYEFTDAFLFRFLRSSGDIWHCLGNMHRHVLGDVCDREYLFGEGHITMVRKLSIVAPRRWQIHRDFEDSEDSFTGNLKS